MSYPLNITFPLQSDSWLWRKLQNPRVRELAWCVCGPDLMRSPGNIDNAHDNQHAIETLLQLEKNPEPLLAWFEGFPHRRLGFLFEHYWQFWWLQHNPLQREYVFNHVINGENRTLGEVDALSWQADEAALTHYELAVKFYLGVHNDGGMDLPTSLPDDWYGPNTQDKLSKKWHHVEAHQLGRHDYHSLGLPDHWHWQQLNTQLITRGRLFYPLTDPHFVVPFADLLNPQHEKGFWLHQSDIPRLKDREKPTDFTPLNNNGITDQCWLLLSRSQWLAPIVSTTKDCLTLEQLVMAVDQHFTETRGSPVQIVQMRAFEPPSNYSESEPSLPQAAADQEPVSNEVTRYFVTPDGWPRITQTH